jgi:hypothetical protein
MSEENAWLGSVQTALEACEPTYRVDQNLSEMRVVHAQKEAILADLSATLWGMDARDRSAEFQRKILEFRDTASRLHTRAVADLRALVAMEEALPLALHSAPRLKELSRTFLR